MAEATLDAAREHAVSGGWVAVDEDGGRSVVRLGGHWIVRCADALDADLRKIAGKAGDHAVFDLSAVSRLDTAGAWLIFRQARRMENSGDTIDWRGLDDRHTPLLELVKKVESDAPGELHSKPTTLLTMLDMLGRGTVAVGRKGLDLTNFLGVVVVTLLRTMLHPSRLRPHAIVSQMELTGLRALPIVGLLIFLIGIVLAYLGANLLRKYGAEIFTVDLIGQSMLREVAVLITAIMIAGRSGSAFTAEIGTMKVNEELDAMRTLGLDPIEILVLPRLMALLITLPLLSFFANIMGVLGGGVLAYVALEIEPQQFVQQLKHAVSLDDFLVGMVKAPVHACIIAIVGCYEGLKVQRSAESVGKQTTMSVVESIFLVIMATSIFSVMFSYLGI
ncbi:MAG: MlaE family lipid ABC transporter permease subunit [Alphaproteobacteria bacterium]